MVTIFETPIASDSAAIPPVTENVEPRLFKTDAGFNINITALARIARDDIASVQTICVPSKVRKHRRRGGEFETPTLSEIGGGVGHDFCQVVAETDAKPISIDNMLSINQDPAWANTNHGTASVEIGSMFSVGWRARTDTVILLYEITNIEELVLGTKTVTLKDDETSPERPSRETMPIAKLTCELCGYSVATWRGTNSAVPDHLHALWIATELRMKSGVDVPFFMDVMRMVKTDDEGREIAENMRKRVYATSSPPPDLFMTKVFEEILDIRANQFSVLLQGDRSRRVDKLRVVETLTLDPVANTIDVGLVLIRHDDTAPMMFCLKLTPVNFLSTGKRMILERGLVLNCPTYERLRAELENRTAAMAIVNLTSFR